MLGGIRAGELNRRVELWAMATTEDETGQNVKSYSKDFDAWAQVKFVRGSEKTKSGREEMQTVYARFKIRFKPQLKATHLIKFNGDFYNIQSMAPMGRLLRDLVEIEGELLDVSTLVLT